VAEAGRFAGYQFLISTNMTREMMRNSNLIDVFGLSGNPSDDNQVDALLSRLKSDTPASENVITVVFEPGELRGHWEKAPSGIILS
jgi:hypothetical protein